MSGSISDVKVWPNKGTNQNVLANAQFTYDNVFKVKCTLWKGKEGSFIGFPGNYGNKTDENGKKIFYPNISCLDENVKTELNEAIMKKYNEVTGNDEMNQGEAVGPVDQEKQRIPF